MNEIYLIGRSGADAELRYTANGTAVLNLSVAVSEKKGDGYETSWFKVSAYSKTAETMAQKIKKGSEVFVKGKLVSRSWDDKTTGQKRTSVEVLAQWLRVIDKSEGAPADRYANQGQQPQMTNHSFMTDGDIPF